MQWLLAFSGNASKTSLRCIAENEGVIAWLDFLSVHCMSCAVCVTDSTRKKRSKADGQHIASLGIVGLGPLTSSADAGHGHAHRKRRPLIGSKSHTRQKHASQPSSEA